MMSADRSVQVGGAVLALGGAVVIARLAYVWAAPSGRFWDVWAMLGVIVGGLGLVIMVVGWVMPSNESSPSQVQAGGERSTNLQAGRDITLHHDSQSGE